MPKLVSKSLDGNVTVTELSEQEHDQYLRNRATAVLIPSPDYGEVVPVNKLRDLILGWTLIYAQSGSSNWENDDTGNESNAAGSADLVLNPLGDQGGWELGYDY